MKWALPAVSSRWALPGFSRIAEEELSSARIDVEKAIVWRGLGCSRLSQIREMLAYRLRDIDEWAKADFEQALAAEQWMWHCGPRRRSLTGETRLGTPIND